jgi:hypothetical protein
MPVLAKSHGIVMRLLIDRTFGAHFHAFFGDAELVIGLAPMRIIQGDAPAWVQDWALNWVRRHQHEVLSGMDIDPALAAPIARHEQLAFAN